MPEKNNSTLGKRLLEILFGVFIGNKVLPVTCLAPASLPAAFSPLPTERASGGTGSLQPLPGKPCWPSRSAGRNPALPRFPHALPTPALGTQQEFCPRKETAHENTHSWFEFTAPTARAWPQGCSGGQLQRAALTAGDSHFWIQGCSSPQCCRQPRHSPALQGPERHLPALQTLCLQPTGSPLLPLGAPIFSAAQTLPARDALRCVSVTPRAEPTLQEHIEAEIPAALEYTPTPEGFKTLQHHSQASFSGVERMGRTRGSCYKYKICYKEKTYIVHL